MSNGFKPIGTPSRTVEIMRKHDLHMKKSLGQNFLVEPQILENMLVSGQVDDSTTVIEIGPGIGALTEFLARHAKKVLAFEIDDRFIGILDDTLSPYDNVQVVHQDILSVDFHSSDYEWLHQEEKLLVIANLPYYITTPIIMNLILSDLPFQRLVMMIQKEVAERIQASVGTKDYSSLTVAIQNRMDTAIAFMVPPTVFIPQPNVESAVLVLSRRPEALVEVNDDEAFQVFVQMCFKQRRKTLWNNLRHAYVNDERSVEELRALVEDIGIDPSRRAETLTIQEFATLYQQLF